ncbi:MAG: hypothetical protein NTV54_08150 [Ignavibacteriales bacterium]|nr:hypothetical protein [Ignavibacteriales bacterium]
MGNLTKFTLAVFAITAISGAAAYWGVSTTFYVWEFVFDAKVIAALCVVFLIWRKTKHRSDIVSILGLRNWRFWDNLRWFILPLALAAIAVGGGLAAKQLAYSQLENAATIALAVLFDIPAILFFSLTVFFAEEIALRGFALIEIKSAHSVLFSILLSSLLWTVYKIPEVLEIEQPNILAICSVILFSFATGVLCATLFFLKKSLWQGYFFRVGASIFFPAILGNFADDSDFFFEAKSVLFLGDGIILSVFILLCSAWIYMVKLRKLTDNTANF